jgi:hypothetical protein
MVFSWRAALCAAPTILALGGSVYLGYHARGHEPPPGGRWTGHQVVIGVSAADEERMHRVALKHEAVMDLLDGRIAFADAVERFRDASTGSPEGLANLREAGFGETDDERLVQQLLSFARVQADRDLRRYGPALARLEQEARTHSSPAVSR